MLFSESKSTDKVPGVKEMENKSDESNEDSIKFSISTLEISEDE
jgi:energy-converting hydrogenase B subunit C